MDVASVQARVTAALRRVRPEAGQPDMVSAGLVEAVEVDASGTVTIRLGLRPQDAPGLTETVRLVASGVEGVSRAIVRRVDPVAADESSAAGGGGIAEAVSRRPLLSPEGTVPASAAQRTRDSVRRRPLPVVGSATDTEAVPSAGRVSREQASRHPRDAEPLAGVRRVIAVSSGKGGVGKSTISTNLAAALARSGHRVGLLDADIYGPDIPTMFGARAKPRMHADKVVPVEAHGVRLMSLGLLVDEETPAIWRGPIIMGIVRQFLHQVDWGELDFLVVDLPPGTGDAQLSLVQLVRVSGAVMVTTPQDVSVAGVLKGIRMFESVEVPIVGLVENMRGFVCPSCEAAHDIFGSGGGERLAGSLGVPFLGAVPLGLSVREEGDRGVPTVIGRPRSPEGQALAAVARAVEQRVEELAEEARAP